MDVGKITMMMRATIIVMLTKERTLLTELTTLPSAMMIYHQAAARIACLDLSSAMTMTLLMMRVRRMKNYQQHSRNTSLVAKTKQLVCQENPLNLLVDDCEKSTCSNDEDIVNPLVFTCFTGWTESGSDFKRDVLNFNSNET